MNRRLICLGFCLACAACQRDRPAPVETPAPVIEPAPPNGAPKPAADGVSGRVVETMNAAGYTYARLDRGDAQFWIAGPETKLAVGTKLGRMDGELMPNFRSETLQRTFDQIYFVSAFAFEGGAPPAVAAVPPAQAPPPAAGDDISGTVLETMNAGGYTYAHLDRDGTKLWIAGPEAKLAIGAKLGRMTGTLMTNFHSDTLARTFDQIYFVGAYSGAAATAPANPHGANPAAVAEPVAKLAPAPGGKTVADIFANKAALAGKPVVVRGKVVKLNTGILGKNWVHVRDGTGADGTNDLLVTTQATPAVGDIVVVRGKVALDQDFGASYRYAVLVEDATLASQ
jgi:hypothetical protein